MENGNVFKNSALVCQLISSNPFMHPLAEHIRKTAMFNGSVIFDNAPESVISLQKTFEQLSLACDKETISGFQTLQTLTSTFSQLCGLDNSAWQTLISLTVDNSIRVYKQQLLKAAGDISITTDDSLRKHLMRIITDNPWILIILLIENSAIHMHSIPQASNRQWANLPMPIPK